MNRHSVKRYTLIAVISGTIAGTIAAITPASTAAVPVRANVGWAARSAPIACTPKHSGQLRGTITWRTWGSHIAVDYPTTRPPARITTVYITAAGDRRQYGIPLGGHYSARIGAVVHIRLSARRWPLPTYCDLTRQL